ncbi:MAG: hypothetical protein Q9210_007014 [Variospora velana]
MWRFLICLALFLLNISSATSATIAAQDGPISQDTLPSNIAGGLFNAPAEVRIANGTLLAGRTIACFIQKEAHEKRLFWITYMDCYSAMARGLLVGDDVMERKIFTTGNKPFSWNGGSCMIIIDQKGTAAPRIQKAEIAHYASLVTRLCVRHSPEGEPLGGQMAMGERDAYTLTVYGREWPPG